MNADSLLALLQFGDGLFPTGAYAHSYGLETYVQRQIIDDIAGAERFVRAYLQGAMGYADATALVNALRAARIEDLDHCLELDLILDAMKPVAELREASRQMGRQTLRILSTLRDESLIGEFARRADVNTTPVPSCRGIWNCRRVDAMDAARRRVGVSVLIRGRYRRSGASADTDRTAPGPVDYPQAGAIDCHAGR